MNNTQQWSAAAVVAEMRANYERTQKRLANMGHVWVDGVCRNVLGSYSTGPDGETHTYVVAAAGAYNGQEYIERFCGEWTREIGYGKRRVIDLREGFGPAMVDGAFYTSTREERLSA